MTHTGLWTTCLAASLLTCPLACDSPGQGRPLPTPIAADTPPDGSTSATDADGGATDLPFPVDTPVTDTPPVEDSAPDAASPDVPPEPDTTPDAAPPDVPPVPDVPAVPDVPPPSPCAAATPGPTARLWPQPGELFYAQIGLGGFAMGESAIAVGPDGTIVIIDTGNDSHDDDVRAALADVIDHMNAAGFAARPDDVVDHVVVTHVHADHSDGLQDLLGKVTLTGRVVHRGMFDLVAVNGPTGGQLCEALAANPGAELALCEGPQSAPCNDGAWSGTYPVTGCSGLDAGDLLVDGDAGPAYLPLGAARLDVIAVDGHIAGESFEDQLGPMDDDSNGENARSLVGMLRHGPFKLLFAGDLTGGGSSTDPVEAYYASRFAAASDLDALGVDVLQANHHARKTSNSAVWVNALQPADGHSRNVVMGISTAHAGSPYQETLAAFFDGERLAGGRGWATLIAPGGATAPELVTADGGQILLATQGGGASYVVQAVTESGVVLESLAYQAVATCAP